MKKIIKYEFAPGEMVVRLSKRDKLMTVVSQPEELIGEGQLKLGTHDLWRIYSNKLPQISVSSRTIFLKGEYADPCCDLPPEHYDSVKATLLAFGSEVIEDVPSIWELKNCDMYYIILADGEIRKYPWLDWDHDILLRSIGNCFLTREQAEAELQRRRYDAKGR